MMAVRFRRARTDYPAGIIGVYDNGGRSADRYSVVFDPYEYDGQTYWPIMCMSAAPFWPQGICLTDSIRGARPGTQGNRYGNALGRVIAFTDLNSDCQRAALNFMAD